MLGHESDDWLHISKTVNFDYLYTKPSPNYNDVFSKYINRLAPDGCEIIV